MRRRVNVDFDEIVANPVESAACRDGEVRMTAIEDLGRQIRDSLDRASRLAAQDTAKEFAQIWGQVARRIAIEWRETLPTLAAHGWYLDGGLSPSVVKSIVGMMHEDTAAEADILLTKYFDRNTDRIKNELFEMFPSRRSLLRSAFAAHRERRYSLAIPIMLAQADGICFDEFGLSLFMHRERKQIKERLGGLDDEMDAVISPLLSLEYLAGDTRKHSVSRDAFNRHAILHGLVLNYGTHPNSCRAISFLSYIHVVIRRWRQSAARSRRLTTR